MTSVNSIAGNSGFTKVANTVVDVQSINAARADLGLANIYQVTGTATLLVAQGNYKVVDANAVTLKLPEGATVTYAAVIADGVVDAAATSAISVGLSLTDGSAVVDALYTRVAAAGVLVPAAEVAPTVVGGTNNFLAVTIGTADLAVAGSLPVHITYSL